MARRGEFELEGVVELDRKLQALAKSVGPDAVEPVIFEGAEMVTAEVQTNVNAIRKVTGNLRRSPVTRMMDRREGGNPRPSISAIDRAIAPHAHFVETGSGRGPQQPFFRPAWDTTRPRVKKYIADGLKRLVEEAARR